MPAEREASAHRRLLDHVVGDEPGRAGLREVQDLGRQRYAAHLREHVGAGAAGGTDLEEQRAVDHAHAGLVEVARDHQRHVTRHRLGHPIVVHRHDAWHARGRFDVSEDPQAD